MLQDSHHHPHPKVLSDFRPKWLSAGGSDSSNYEVLWVSGNGTNGTNEEHFTGTLAGRTALLLCAVHKAPTHLENRTIFGNPISCQHNDSTHSQNKFFTQSFWASSSAIGCKTFWPTGPSQSEYTSTTITHNTTPQGYTLSPLRFNSIQFNSIQFYLYSAKLQQLSSQGT